MILTQLDRTLPADKLVLLADTGADELACYRPQEGVADAAAGCALVQEFNPAPTAIATNSLPKPVSGVATARYLCTEVSDSGPAREPGPVLMIVAFDVPPALQGEVERWYSEEHIPLLRRAPGWLRARRYEVQAHGGGPHWSSIALHELRDTAVLDSAERAYARATPWRARLSSQPWFAAAGRFVYQRFQNQKQEGAGHAK